MQDSEFKMNFKKLLKWQVSTLALFAVLLGLSTAFLRATVCIEGGTVIGYPRYFLAQCYEMGPGTPMGPAEFVLVSLLIDVVFWYLVSMVLVLVSVVAYGRLRRPTS